MKINIVCEDDGWIYGKFVDMFKKHSKYSILVNSKKKCSVTHYLPYYLVPKKPETPCTAWMSHQEEKDPLKTKFITAARAVNVAISQSKKYAWVLKRNHVGRVVQIITGVDLETLRLRNSKRPGANDFVAFMNRCNPQWASRAKEIKNGKEYFLDDDNKCLRVGYVGRHYTSSNRKNPKLLDNIMNLDFCVFCFTGGKIKERDIPEFYANCDIIVQPSLIEGGSLAIQESLAVGTPILCYKGVGVADEFNTGVIKVPYNDGDEFLGRLKTIWATKSYLHYRKPQIMREMRKQVKDFTWENFVARHDAIWEGLAK